MNSRLFYDPFYIYLRAIWIVTKQIRKNIDRWLFFDSFYIYFKTYEGNHKNESTENEWLSFDAFIYIVEEI